MHVVILRLYFLWYNLQLKVYNFSSIFGLQCYQFLINAYIYVVPLSANAPTVLHNSLWNIWLCLCHGLKIWVFFWINFLSFVSVFCSMNLSSFMIVHIFKNKHTGNVAGDINSLNLLVCTILCPMLIFSKINFMSKSTIFQSCHGGSSWVETVLSRG